MFDLYGLQLQIPILINQVLCGNAWAHKILLLVKVILRALYMSCIRKLSGEGIAYNGAGHWAPSCTSGKLADTCVALGLCFHNGFPPFLTDNNRL